ncbi:response regulator [Methanosphaerula palustris]|uniref:Response regulator receiver protein n=1 Tax=Methanosphaerula palustris (strain ATCC BAA-1556 / DSM 19958 / E1-9c) TaxID=521011 RepID=B8GDV4_METPE|nr:response regulator [Methanosphaerula palustris]ACL17455.1 response regulator receiver protein [Methanosphaerula palustris E1-9c]
MKHTIMIVDDNTYIVEGLMAILKRRDYQVISAKEGAECLKLLKTITPDVILLDLTMEPMDGWEILEQIKGDQAIRHIPVIIFSGREITAVEKQEHGTLVEDFMLKPINPKNLLDKIEQVVKRQSPLPLDLNRPKEAGIGL